jgi:hypothetical protein
MHPVATRRRRDSHSLAILRIPFLMAGDDFFRMGLGRAATAAAVPRMTAEASIESGGQALPGRSFCREERLLHASGKWTARSHPADLRRDCRATRPYCRGVPGGGTHAFATRRGFASTAKDFALVSPLGAMSAWLWLGPDGAGQPCLFAEGLHVELIEHGVLEFPRPTIGRPSLRNAGCQAR